METSMSANTARKLKYYSILDLVRFIAALLIITIHIFPEGSTTSSVGLDNSIPIILGESFVYSILRPAVPIFFVISSFLLFKKIDLDPDNRWKYVRTFCLRLLFLHLFWFIVGLPLTIKDITSYISSGDNYNLIRYFVVFFFKGAPRGYWYLVTLALGVVITCLCKSKKTLTVLAIISGLMYIYGCLNSAYFGLFTLSNDPVSKALFTVGNYLELSFCYLQGFIFIVLGRIFAIHDIFKIKGNIIFVILSFLFMVGELFLTMYLKVFIYPDAYFFLPVFIFFFMNMILSIYIENERFSRVTRKLKKVGSFSYLFHIQFFCYLHWILDATNHNIFRENYFLLIIPYVVCVLLCFGLQTLFEYLSKYKYLRFFKYSY